MPAFSQNGEHSAKARRELSRKLRLAAELERKAGEELDRLVSVAIEIGMSDKEIGELAGMSAGAIYQRRRKPIFCKVCEAPMGYPGRGRPPERCEDCR